MPEIVLFQPEIPQNTGNISRTCAATGTPLHLIEPLGFELSDRQLKRAGLDYWHALTLHIHKNYQDFVETCRPGRLWAFSTKGGRRYDTVEYGSEDFLLFGRETSGLPEELYRSLTLLRIPMRPELRSLNLSNAVALTLYEALRQNGFQGFE